MYSVVTVIPTEQRRAINECLSRHIPFVIYGYPHEQSMTFMASLPDGNGESRASFDPEVTKPVFFISNYGADEPYVAGVSGDMDEHALLEYVAANPDARFAPSSLYPYQSSTLRLNYREALDVMRRRVKKVGGKVVLSRHVAMFSNRPIVEAADSYFHLANDTFRYMCFTPENGLWIGGTPELLLESDAATGSLSTMALAGTRPATGDGREWDDKNKREHAIVVDYIAAALKALGLEVNVGKMGELATGVVEHLCTPITARGDNPDYPAIINALNPTPAVAGVPRDIAMAEIDALETHQRRCYSGVVGLRNGGDIRAYVNLRCAFGARATLDGDEGWLYNLYAGGGIMPDSKMKSEWAETEEKLRILSMCLEPPPSLEGYHVWTYTPAGAIVKD